ncbi:MAG: ERCC4 domain-containing protein [Nanoarchaeota archaeon]|nr:ERCC4 domain-containing protein [Nanoarchaeota archaeon]
MKIIVDVREKKSGIIVDLAKKGFDVDLKQLPFADYIIETKDRDGNVHSLGVEKKTQSDFLSSIVDKRILRQLLDLKKNFSRQLLIIEGDRNIYTLRNFHPNAIRGMLASIAIDFQIPTIHTKTSKDTASLLAVIAKRMEKPSKHYSLIQKRKAPTLKEQQEYLVETLPGVGPSLAKSLLRHFKTIRELFTAREEEIRKIDKMGEKKAEKIIDIINHEYKE